MAVKALVAEGSGRDTLSASQVDSSIPTQVRFFLSA
jgi:hypothetical protein